MNIEFLEHARTSWRPPRSLWLSVSKDGTRFLVVLSTNTRRLTTRTGVPHATVIGNRWRGHWLRLACSIESRLRALKTLLLEQAQAHAGNVGWSPCHLPHAIRVAPRSPILR